MNWVLLIIVIGLLALAYKSPDVFNKFISLSGNNSNISIENIPNLTSQNISAPLWLVVLGVIFLIMIS